MQLLKNVIVKVGISRFIEFYDTYSFSKFGVLANTASGRNLIRFEDKSLQKRTMRLKLE